MKRKCNFWPLFEHNCCLCLPACTRTHTYGYARTNLARSRLCDVSTKAWQLILRLGHSCAATRMKSFLPSIILSLSSFFGSKAVTVTSPLIEPVTYYIAACLPLHPSSSLPPFPLAVQFLTAIFLALTKASRSKLRWMKANRQQHRRIDRGVGQ